MSETTNFRELLAKPTDQVERPKPLAVGHYIGTVKGHEFGRSKNKGTPFVRFFLIPAEECSDVAEGLNNGTNLAARELRKDYYILPTSIYRLSDMLDAVLGKAVGRSFDQRIPETRGVRAMFMVTQTDSEDGTATFNEVTTIVAPPT